jgi:hypothetical protein
MNIYEMKLHDSFELKGNYGITYIITRVPGGWLYHYVRLDCNSMTCTFVPWNANLNINLGEDSYF